MKILEKDLWNSSPESDIEWEENLVNPEKQKLFDCVLCGKPKLIIKSRDPCQKCIKLYPDNRKCQSCGRVYPDQTCFAENGSCCKYCIKRRAKTKNTTQIPKTHYKKIGKTQKKTLKSIDLKLGDVLIGKFFIEQ